MKFQVIVADCPWPFSDRLTMTDVKRGAGSNYSTLSIQDLKNIPISSIADDDAVLAHWVPSSLLQEGLDVMKAWGFEHKQTHIWVKTKKDPLDEVKKEVFKRIKNKEDINDCFDIDLDGVLGFGMGRLFRQTHELVLIGTKGKIYNQLKNKSQRSVHFYKATRHSEKPEKLQDMLDIMFPNSNKIELFARRQRDGWICVGNEAPQTLGEDIRESLKRYEGVTSKF